ncbi:hypothetical protein C3Y87_20845 [Carbonactinospora thermoautotrophica]|nr:hypothetical protein [Carbonactinospora thermoautotrophica]
MAFGRGLAARGLSGVQLVTSDAHPGLIAAVGATLPGAARQWCRIRDLSNNPRNGGTTRPDTTPGQVTEPKTITA